MSDAKCENCKFFHAYDTGYSECRYDPPKLHAFWMPLDLTDRPPDKFFRGHWPLVYKNGWCGRYEKAVS